MRYEDVKKSIMQVLEFAKANGYKCYFVDAKRIMSAYGYMITPKGNVMYVQTGDFGGWEFSIPYVPSREHGSGCMCLEEPVFEVDVETLRKAEEEGLAFAGRLKATQYANAEQWLRCYWDKDSLVEV